MFSRSLRDRNKVNTGVRESGLGAEGSGLTNCFFSVSGLDFKTVILNKLAPVVAKRFSCVGLLCILFNIYVAVLFTVMNGQVLGCWRGKGGSFSV